jgi:hypothetical protein
MYSIRNTIHSQPTLSGDYGVTFEKLMLIRKLECPFASSLHARGDIATRFQ